MSAGSVLGYLVGSTVRLFKNILVFPQSSVSIRVVTSSPQGGGGVPAAIGSIAIDSSSAEVYIKLTASDTGWEQIVTRGT